MKSQLTTTLKTLLADRFLTTMVVALIVLSIVYCIYVAVSLRPSDLQVAVHYTAFGGTNFYREKWYYLINFVALGVLIGAIHSALIVKFHMMGKRELALMFAWASLLLLGIAFFMARSVLRVAFL